jgi:hypothetical protein
MKICGSGSIATCVLNLSTEMNWVVSVTLRVLYRNGMAGYYFQTGRHRFLKNLCTVHFPARLTICNPKLKRLCPVSYESLQLLLYV